ncbi:MAG: hypothetical protein AAF304_09290, partial [Pseudomonadota bacterium]
MIKCQAPIVVTGSTTVASSVASAAGFPTVSGSTSATGSGTVPDYSPSSGSATVAGSVMTTELATSSMPVT